MDHQNLTASNEAGSDTTCQNIVYGTVSTREVVQEPQFSVFPNPTIDGTVQVVLPSAARRKYTLTDRYGRVVKAGVFTERVDRLRVSAELAKGVYFLRIEGVGVRKVVFW